MGRAGAYLSCHRTRGGVHPAIIFVRYLSYVRYLEKTEVTRLTCKRCTVLQCLDRINSVPRLFKG